MTRIFAFDDYMDFLQSDLEENKVARGYQARLAKAGGMHPSYLSRILNHSTHLTLDQAAGLCEFWKLTHDETHYFLNLVNLARAGTPALKRTVERELKALKKKNDELGDRLPAEKMDLNKENIYYSGWYYCAVHVLLTIPEFRTESAIAEKLGIPRARLRPILQTLEALGLAQKTQSEWKPTKSNIHLSNQSWMAGVHHANWRSKMIDLIQFDRKDDLHYTGIHSLSVKDAGRIREMLQQILVNVDEVVRPSQEEELTCLLIDWVKI